MAKAFYFNQAYCTGCKACQIACKDRNNLPVGSLFRRVESYEVGVYPDPHAFHYSKSCHHCEDPVCMKVCPVGAFSKNEDGVVVQDRELCIGCQSCVNNCPFGAPSYIEELGVSGKCDTCLDIRAEGGVPQCVSGCPMRALDFGEIDELLERHPEAVSIEEMVVVPASDAHPQTLARLKPIACSGEPRFIEY